MSIDKISFVRHEFCKVLLCAIEQSFHYTLKVKTERLKASHPNLFITDRIPENVSDYKFVFIDSVSKTGIEISDTETLRKLNPETSFIFIYHTTKQGRFRGANTHAHDVDLIIEVTPEEAKASMRFISEGRISL